MSKKIQASENNTERSTGNEVTGSDLGGGKRGLDIASHKVGLSAYVAHFVEDGDTIYIGKMKTDSTWLVQKVVDSDVITITYANVGNNATRTTLDAAWTNRATLTYAKIDTLTGV